MRAIFVLPLLLLAGCSSSGVVNTATPAIAVIPVGVASAASGVSVIASADGRAVIGPVEAHACQKYQYDPQPTDELAIAMLKAEAAAKGATAVAGVVLRTTNVDMARNCYTTIHATGLALR